MRWGVYSGELATNLPYAQAITAAASENDVPTALLYAIAWHETIGGEVDGLWTASTVISPDGGHGICQLTASFPDDWNNPQVNASYACSNFILPAAQFWTNGTYKFSGLVLVKAIAATFNAGINGALAGHVNGDLDLYTTKNDGVGYGTAVLAIYENIIKTGRPTT